MAAEATGYWAYMNRAYRLGTASLVRPADWLYPLASGWTDFMAGSCCGEQVIVGPYDPSLIACFFDRDGVLLRVERRPQRGGESDPDPERDAHYLGIMRQGLDGDPAQKLEALAWFCRPIREAWDWAREMGVQLGTVRVRRFCLPDVRVGIEDGNRLHEEGIIEDAEGWENWLRSGTFVFWWSRDLWVNGEGKVFST